MFEKLLGGLLKRLLGDYIEGFDASNLNLSLWSGEINIENVRLKKEAMRMLGLPVNVRYSFVRKLRLKIPWQSLTSSKTEVYLDGVYLILGYQPESDWQLRNDRLVEQRKQELNDFKEAVLKRYAERLYKKNAEQDDGFTSRLVLKIIDNIQIEVSDIHLRFYDQEEEEYAFGVTMEKLKINTVNKYGVEEYIDRTKPEYQNEPLRKHLYLKNLGVYWSRKAQMTGVGVPYLQIQERLRNMFKKTEAMGAYIVLVSFRAKLFQSQKGNFSAPYTLLQVDMESVKIDVDDRQLQQMITLSEKLQRFRYRVKMTNQNHVTPEQRTYLLQVFSELYSKYYGKQYTDYSADDLKKYYEVLALLPTEELMRTMKKYILDREKQRMVMEKSAKTGWFSYGKKELTEAEVTEIEDFLVKNFNEEYRPVRRPIDYFYLIVEVNLHRAEIMLGSKMNYLSYGVALVISYVSVRFRLREGGHHLKVAVADLHNDLFSVDLTTGLTTRTSVFSKIEKFRDQKYLYLELESNPVALPNISTDLNLSIKASIIVFNPELVVRLRRFSNLKVNQENREAAIEKFGEIRSQTSANLSRSFTENQQELKLTNINVSITAPLVIVPFEPGGTQYCWGVNMGLLEIHTDPELLKRQIVTKEAFDVKLEHLNLGWFGSVDGCQRFYQHGIVCKPMQNIIEDFQVHLLIEKSSEINQPDVPKLLLRGTIPNLYLKLSEYSFSQLKLLDRAFAAPETYTPQGPERRPAVDLRMVSEDEKQSILNNREKLGMLYKRNNTSKLWQKYTCVLSGNYLYLYGSASKLNYEECIYIKNTIIFRVDEASCGRSNTMELNNKVDSGVMLSFDKPAQYEEWERAISSKRDPSLLADTMLTSVLMDLEDSPKKVRPPEPVNYKQIKLSVAVELQELRLIVYSQKYYENWLDVHIRNFNTLVEFYETRKSITIMLSKLDIYDGVQKYRDPELDFLLKTDIVDSDSHLISVSILQIDPKDPEYQQTDNDIRVAFGVQRVNWKPQTIRKLFQFFLPSESEAANPDNILGDVVKDILLLPEPEFVEIIEVAPKKPIVKRVFLNILVTVREITLSLINRNNNVKIYELLFKRLAFSMSDSTYETDIKVRAGNLLISDCSGYPNTILTDRYYRPNLYTFVRSLEDTLEDNLVEVSVRILNDADVGQKDLFVNVVLNHIYIDFMKQPFLRMIDYIIHQFIPSLDGKPDNSQPYRKSSLKKPQHEPPIKHPYYSTWSLSVYAVKSVVRLRPSVYYREEVVDLHITKVIVNKDNFYREYIRNKSGTVLVTAFTIDISQTYLSVRDHQITNGLDLKLIINSVEEPRYYRRYYGEEFEDGLRLSLQFSAFLLRVSNRDINTILKCLKWNIGYDDNCGRVLMPYANPEQQSESSQDQSPFYLDVKAEKVTLVAGDNSKVPIASFSVHRVEVLMVDRNQQGLTLQASVGELTSSSFTRIKTGKIVERGMLRNTIAVKDQEYNSTDLLEIPELVRLLDLRESAVLRLVEDFHQLKIRLQITNELGTVVEVRLEQFKFCLELLPLLSLSKLADGDDSMVPPPPRLPPAYFIVRKESVKKNNTTEVTLHLTNTSICTRNSQADYYTGIAGDLNIHLVLKPSKTKHEVAELSQSLAKDIPVENTKVSIMANDFTIYLTQTDIRGTTKRRTLLLPLNLLVEITERYLVVEDKLTLTNYILVQTEMVGLKATVRDLMSLGKIGMENIKILEQWTKENAIAGREIEKLREVEKEVTVHKQRRKSMHLANAQNLVRKEESVIPAPPLSRSLAEEDEAARIVNPDIPLTNQTAEISFRQLYLEIINDCGNMFVPVLQLLLAQSRPVMNSSLAQTNIGTLISLEVNFFNPRSARWEPILYRCKLTLGYIVNRGSNESTEIVVTTDKEDQLNINISSQMIRSLEYSVALAKLELSSTEKRIFSTDTDEELEVSPYVFWNLTNTAIDVIVPDHPRKQTVTSLFGPTDKLPLRTKTLSSRFKGSVYIPVQSNEITLRIGEATYAVNINIFGKRRICNSRYFIECKVEKLNRLVKLTGDLYLLNDTNQNVFVQMLDSKVEYLQPKMELPLEGIERICLGSDVSRLSDIINLYDRKEVSSVSSNNGHTHYSLLKTTRLISGLECNKFFLRTPLRVLNCLPRPVLFQAYPKGSKPSVSSKSIKSQSEFEFYRYGHVRELTVRISVPGYLWSAPLELSANINRQVDIVLKDKLQNPTVVKASIIWDETTSTLLLTFFTSAYLINDTPYNLLTYSLPKQLSQNQQYRVAGQIAAAEGYHFDQNLIMLGAEVGNQLKFAEMSTPDELSSIVRIDQLGYNEAVIEIRQAINGRFIPTYLTLGVDIEVKEMYKDSQVLTKEVRVTTRHIIMNKTNSKLYYRQEGTEDVFQLEKDQRRVAFLLNKDPEKRKVIFRSGSSSEYSTPVNLKSMGTTHFYVRERGEKVFMRMSVRVIDNFVYLVVERLPNDQPPYQLYNRVKNLTVRVPQLNEYIKYKERANFSWENPNESHLISLKFLHEYSETVQSLEVDPDQVNSKQQFCLELRNGKKLNLELLNQLSNSQDTRVITIQREPEKPVEYALYLLAQLYISRIGVSFILNHETVARPYYFVYGYLQNLEFLNERTRSVDTYQLRLGFMQIDQNYPNELMTPVVFTPEKYNAHAGITNNHLINAVFRIDRRSQRHLIIKEITVEIRDVTVRISEHFIKVLRDISRDTTKNQYDYMIRKSKDAWLQLQLPEQDGMMYIQQMNIFPFNVQLTCHIKPQALQYKRGYVLADMAIQVAGVAFTNIEEAHITLKGITLSNSYETVEGVVGKLVVHYKRNFFNEVYKIFGSLNIIGNPMGLFNNITTGLTDLIARPVEGAVQGPFELGKGIVSGTHSLVSHTVGGVVGSFSQITQSLSNGLTILCFDRYYEQIRDRERMNPPSGMLNGFGQGATALYLGVREGILGYILNYFRVVGQPYRGAKKNGLLGGMLGLVTGITGIVIKPVTGVLDALTKSSEGLKSTVMGYEDRANTQRIRSPRVFYGGNSLIKSYNPADAQMYQTLYYLDKKYTGSPFIQSFVLKDERFALVVLESYVVLLNLTDSSIRWGVDTHNILYITVNTTNKELTVVLKYPQKFHLHSSKLLSIDCVDDEQREEMRRLLVEMVQLRERVIEEPY